MKELNYLPKALNFYQQILNVYPTLGFTLDILKTSHKRMKLFSYMSNSLNSIQT